MICVQTMFRHYVTAKMYSHSPMFRMTDIWNVYYTFYCFYLFEPSIVH